MFQKGWETLKTVLCVDIGTSSLKAALIAQNGSLYGYGKKQFLFRSTKHSADEWFPALIDVITQIRQESFENPLAVCISGNGPTLVSDDGTTLLWNEEVPSIKSRSLFIPRISAFKNKYPESWDKTSFILSGPEYLMKLLSGTSVTVLPESRFEEAYWTDSSLKEANLFSFKEKLPPFVAPGFCLGGVTKNVSLTTGIKEGTPVIAGAPDFVSALIGTATLLPGRLCDRAGSSEGINFCTEKPLFAEGVRTLPSVQKNLWNASVLLPRSGDCFADFKMRAERERGHELSFAFLVDEILSYLKNPCEKNSLMEDGSLLVKKIACTLRDGINLLRNSAQKEGFAFPSEMTVTGGQSLHDGWNQFKADVTGMRISVPECRDAELSGDAAIAFCSLGVFDSLTEAASSLCKIRNTFVPQKDFSFKE